MAFTVADFPMRLNILHQNPEWRKELRRAALTEEILTLPSLVCESVEITHDLVKAQQRAEERLEQISTRRDPRSKGPN